jgi:transposase
MWRMSHALRANYAQQFLLPPSLEDWVPPEHPVRFVRDLVDSLELNELGFRESKGEEGRPHYATELLLKVWLYGWMERVRSSRGLEKACLRDVAFLWLMGNHHPDHNTLWRFFRDNRKALRKLFKRVVQVAAQAGLVGFALHALDGTKIVAASSMDTALHRKSLEEQLKTLEQRIEVQMQEVEKAEEQETGSYAMPASMRDAQARKAEIVKALAALDEAETGHLHPNEPEARVMKGRTQRTLSYNAQAVVDHDSDLIVAADVITDETDHAQLVPMVEQVAETLGRTAEQTCADTGYYGGEQIAQAEHRHLPVLVALQDESGTKGDFNKSHFHYEAEHDGYRCPRGELLPLERLLKPTTDKPYPIALYRCGNTQCPVRAQCTTDKHGRTIKRTPFEEALVRQAQKQQNPAMAILLSLRKEIVEHLFGIVKGIDGFRRFTVRGLEKVQAQWALICAAVNVRKLYAFWQKGQLTLGR